MPKDVKSDKMRAELRKLKNRGGRRPLIQLLTTEFLDGSDEVFRKHYTEEVRMYAGVDSVTNEGIFERYVKDITEYISRYFGDLGKDLGDAATKEEKLIIEGAAGRMYLWFLLTPKETVTFHGRMPLLTSEMLRTIFQGLDRLPDAISEVSVSSMISMIL